MHIRINGAVAAHGDDHAGDLGRDHLFRDDLNHFLRSPAGIIIVKQDPRLLDVAHKAVNGFEEIPPLQSDGHVAHHGVDLLSVLLGQPEDPLDDFLVNVDLANDAVGVRKNLVAVVIQNVRDGQKVRPLGDGGRHIALVIKYRQPGAHTVPGTADVVRIDLVVFQLLDHVRTVAAPVHQADKGGPKLTVGDVLRHVPSHAAVDPFHPAGVAPVGNKITVGIPLHIHKNRTDDHNAHRSLFLRFLFVFRAIISAFPRFCNTILFPSPNRRI